MYCKNCGNKIKAEEKFCASCGLKKDSVDNQDKSVKVVNQDAMSLIECSKCHHVGPGKAGRSTFGQILAWGFFGIPTLIYYGMTKKFKCVKCGSKKIQIKKDGLFVNGKKNNTVAIVIGAIVVILALKFCSAVVLASLNSARQKVAESKLSSMTNEDYIKQVVAEAKKQATLPSETDKYTTMTDIVAEQSSLRYEYTLHGLDLSSYTNDIFNQKMKPLLAEDVCKNDSMVGFLDRGIDVKYSYLDEETYKNFLVTFTKGDCL